MAESTSSVTTSVVKTHSITALATDAVDLTDLTTVSAVKITADQNISVDFNTGGFTITALLGGKIDLTGQAVTAISITNQHASNTATVRVSMRKTV